VGVTRRKLGLAFLTKVLGQLGPQCLNQVLPRLAAFFKRPEAGPEDFYSCASLPERLSFM
jgi:hypothetical protein